MDEKTLIQKIAWIVGENEHRVMWDIPKQRIIELLVMQYEKLAEETEVSIYER